MSRTTTRMTSRWVVAAALGLATLSVPELVAPATAAGETCREIAATIVGVPEGSVEGTPGDDVIVSNGATRVDAGGGDDLICTTNTAGRVFVLTGPGTDVVDRSGDLEPTDPSVSGTIELSGADEFVGGPGRDEVWDVNPTTGRIATGAGHDDIRIYAGTTDPHVEIDGGDGRDSLSLGTRLHGRWTIDFRTGARPTSPRTVTGVGLETFAGGTATRRHQVAARDEYRFFGTAAEEFVHMPAAQVRLIRLGGGDDVADLEVSNRSIQPSGRAPLIDGGAGTDEISVGQWVRVEVLIDLATDRFDVGFGNAGPPQYRIPGFENASVTTASARIAGDAGPNVLTTLACPEVMRGRGGDDVLVFSGYVKFTKTCEEPGQRFAMYGGPGDDDLRGSWLGNDVLIGGPGVDSANGSDGFDRCAAETMTECEATPRNPRSAGPAKDRG